MNTFSNYTLISTSNLFKNFVAFIIWIAFGLNAHSQCPIFYAYNGIDSIGNQNYTENLGMIFTVNQSIKVSALGAFDSKQDGLKAPITVGIFSIVGSTLVAGPVTLSGTSDPLYVRHRVQSISPVVLPPGQYVVVALGYGPLEANGNTNLGNLPTTLNTNGGLVTFNSASFGGTVLGVPPSAFAVPNGFHAGTFLYTLSDTTPPTISCPANKTVNTSQGSDAITRDCRAVVDSIAPFNTSDNCVVSSITYTKSSPSIGSGSNDASLTFFNTGITTVIYSITDNSGNSATCSFTVTVIDDEAPTLYALAMLL
jgi:HYR domain